MVADNQSITIHVTYAANLVHAYTQSQMSGSELSKGFGNSCVDRSRQPAHRATVARLESDAMKRLSEAQAVF